MDVHDELVAEVQPQRGVQVCHPLRGNAPPSDARLGAPVFIEEGHDGQCVGQEPKGSRPVSPGGARHRCGALVTDQPGRLGPVQQITDLQGATIARDCPLPTSVEVTDGRDEQVPLVDELELLQHQQTGGRSDTDYEEGAKRLSCPGGGHRT
jgi:hypothetical protein